MTKSKKTLIDLEFFRETGAKGLRMEIKKKERQAAKLQLKKGD
jgi:hypothetical protein